MPKFSDMFPSGVEPGMYSPPMLEEMEREKARERLKAMLNEKRKAKVAQKTEKIQARSKADDVPELPVDLPETKAPAPQSFAPMPQQAPQNAVPDLIPEPSQPGSFNPSTYQPEPTPQAGPIEGFAGRPEDDEMDSRKMLYDYLKNRRASEPEFQDQYKNLSNEAESGRVMNTWLSGLGEMASMAGTLQGKRSDPGDMKSLPAAIYGAQRNQANEMLNLRQLSNQEQRGDIQMLRDIERGDLDALRTQKILQDMKKQRSQPKTLPYFVPSDGKNPPRMVMMDADGQLVYQDLPPGARPTNETYMMGEPVYVGGKPVYPQTGSKTGQTTFVEAPEGAKTAKQMQFESQAEADAADRRLKEIEAARKNANDADRRRLDEEELKLKDAIFQWKKSQGGKKGKDVAGDALDRAFVKDYEELVARGGLNSMRNKIEMLRSARNRLAEMKPPSRAVGMVGESGIDLFAPEYAAVMSDVRKAMQESLRATYGSQFTEREGEQVLARAFNPRQSKEENLRRIDQEIKQIVIQAKAREEAVKYFEKNGTLKGFKSGAGSSSESGKTVVKKQYSPSRDRTRITYSDGSTEELDGRQ